MFEKIKKVTAVLLIALLLPYIITIFINGESMGTGKNQLLEQYCIGVLAKEVSSDYEDEMLKAQAVLVRTTVYQNVMELDKDTIEKPDLDAGWYQKLKSIWKETDGQVLMYENKLALVPFHQLSNGRTRSGKEVFGNEDYPYLTVKECPKDVEAAGQMKIQVISVENATIKSTDNAGYVTEVQVGEEVCTGDHFRDTYDLVSSCFELQDFEGKTRVTTRGIGHGLGMSQYTANEMAKNGSNYKEILQYFFDGTEIKEIAEILWEIE